VRQSQIARQPLHPSGITIPTGYCGLSLVTTMPRRIACASSGVSFGDRSTAG
jgi:hypothetical protein